MKSPPQIWIIDDDRAIRWVLEKALSQAKLATTSFENADQALARLKRAQPDVILTDIRMPGTDGLALLDQVQISHPHLPVIVMTAYADLERAVAAYQGGAFEYLPKPFDMDDAVAIVVRALSKTAESALPPLKFIIDHHLKSRVRTTIVVFSSYRQSRRVRQITCRTTMQSLPRSRSKATSQRAHLKSSPKSRRSEANAGATGCSESDRST